MYRPFKKLRLRMVEMDYLDVPVWLTVPTSGILHAVC